MGSSSFSISNNQLLVANDKAIYWNASYSGDVWAAIKLRALSRNQTVVLHLRVVSNYWTNGVVEVAYTQGSGITIYSFSGSVWIQAGSTLAASFGAGDVLRANALASGLVEVFKNGTPIGTATVTQWSNVGRAGQIGVWTDASGALLDDFNGGSGTGASAGHKVLARIEQPKQVVAQATPSTGGWTISYYYFNGQRIAMRKRTDNTNGTVNWLHGDHLGSASLATSATGAKVSDMRFKPFGEVRSGSMPTDLTWTGQRAEASSYVGAISDFNARFFSPILGRFLSADSVVPEMGNPQAFNRYSYTYNAPLNYRDPSDHVPVRDIDDECNLLGCRDVVREGGGNIKYDAKTGEYQNFQTDYNSRQIAAPKTAKVPQLPAAGQSSASKPPASSTSTNSAGTNSTGKPPTGASAIQQAMDKSVPAGKSSVGQNIYSTQPEAAAKDLAGRIAAPNTLQPKTTYKGFERLTADIEGGGTVNYRPPQGSKSGHYTVDVHNVPGYPDIIEFKFHLAPNVVAQ